MDRVQKITQAYSLTPWRKQIQGVGLFLTILVIGVIIAIIYVDVSAEAAAVGREIQEKQAQIQDLERSIADKQAELGYITSAVAMEERALDLGFKPVLPGQALYLVVPGYGGRSELMLAPHSKPISVQTLAISPEYSISLVDWVKQQLYLPTP